MGANVTEIPSRGIPSRLPAGFRNAPKPTDEQVWAVCPYLRDSERCRGCPEWEEWDSGRVQRLCYGLAAEVCRVVLTDRSADMEGE